MEYIIKIIGILMFSALGLMFLAGIVLQHARRTHNEWLANTITKQAAKFIWIFDLDR